MKIAFKDIPLSAQSQNCQFYSRVTVQVQPSFHNNWASLFEMALEPNSLDWNGNELEYKLELDVMKRTFEFPLHTYSDTSIKNIDILPLRQY